MKRATDRNGTETLPPHDTEAEAGTLGCVLCADPSETTAMLAKISLEDFYDVHHREIYCALLSLERDGKPLDTVSLAQFLKDTNRTEQVGGFAYIAGLPEETPSPAIFPTFLESIKDLSARRATLRDAAELSILARDVTKPAAAVADAARRMLEVHAQNGNGHGLSLRRPDELLAMTFDDGDRILGDRLLATGQSLVIAGAGSIGKSRLLLQLAVATITGRQFVSFETRGRELRWLILQAENSNRRLQTDLDALRQWVGPDWARVNDRLFIHTLESDVDGFLSVGDPQSRRRIAETIHEAKPDVIGFDSLYNFAIGDLNADQDMAETLLTLSRLSRAGNANRGIVTLHHARTGRVGAAAATGFDRSSFGRNSKVLHSWTRGQINVAPGSPDSNNLLVLSCGKCSNGKEFAPFAIRLNPETMVYEVASDFDLAAWESDITGKKGNRKVTPKTVRELAQELAPQKRTKPALVREIQAETGCGKTTAYEAVDATEQCKLIVYSRATKTYAIST